MTGRPRRCGWFDVPALRRSFGLNGVTGLCVTKLDVLDGMDELSHLHRLPRRRQAGRPAALRRRRGRRVPPGLRDPARLEARARVGVTAFDALPAAAQAYLRRIEALTGVPIAMVSTGPDRAETILLHHPFH